MPYETMMSSCKQSPKAVLTNFSLTLAHPMPRPQAEYRHSVPRLSVLELINTQLSDQVNSLQDEVEEVKVHSEADKKSALDRYVCTCVHTIGAGL